MMHMCQSMPAPIILPCTRVKVDPLAPEDYPEDLDRRQVLKCMYVPYIRSTLPYILCINGFVPVVCGAWCWVNPCSVMLHHRDREAVWYLSLPLQCWLCWLHVVCACL